MNALKACLWIAAIGCLVSIFGLFLPVSTWDKMFTFFGGEPLPKSTIFTYGIRVACAMGALLGVFFVFLAREPEKYSSMIPPAGIGLTFVGIVAVISGYTSNMPTLWFWGDAGFCLILGILILLFFKKAHSS